MTRDESSMLGKITVLLGAFTGGEPLALAELGRRTGLARSTVHRLVTDLAEVGWVRRVDNRYELGMALFELGELVPVKHRLRTVALPYMQDLLSVTGETVHLAVRDGGDAVYAEKLHGHRPLPLPSRVGGRAPLTCTAVGKALLAHESPGVVGDLLSRPLRRWTAGSVTDPRVLTRQLDEIRRTGLALEREEAAPGGACVAAPVLVDGRPVAALSVAVPVAHFAPERLGPAVLTAALGLARALTASRAPS
ncbi:IclR family transcriptional regulator [Blastococcus sp. SYSU D00669]